MWCVMATGCANVAASRIDSQKVIRVSMISLIANPADYHKASVFVQGYLSVPNSGDARLYLREDDFRQAILANSVVVDLTNARVEESCKNAYVVIHGRFVAELSVHGSAGFLEAHVIQKGPIRIERTGPTGGVESNRKSQD